jgi:dihydropyrimidinase
VALARSGQGRIFIVHLASDRGLDLVAAARREGLGVFAETCTHYLVFAEEQLLREDGIKWICSPPLREVSIQEALWRGLADGRISLVSSDDAAYSWKAKLLGRERFDLCPNGIPGVEARLAVLYSEGVARGRISLPRLVELVATAPAELFGLGDRKGRLRPGYDADIVIFNPGKAWTMGRETLHMAADWSAYEDLAVTGKIETVFSRGECVIDGGRCPAEKGRGRFLERRLRR